MAGSERSRPFGLQGPLGLWRPLDRWLAGYASLCVLLLGWGWARGRPGLGEQALLDLAILVVATALRRWSRDTRAPLPTFLRLAFVPLCYWTFYHQVQDLWPLFRAAPLDGLLARLDQGLFGCQPSLAFRAALPFRGLSELFCFAYFTYYLFVPVVVLGALFRRGYAAAEHILVATTATFFTCYTFFWLFPTVGPHFWFPPHLGPRLYDGYLFNHLLYFLTGPGEIRGGAFPSSHIAMALLLTLHARRSVPKAWPVLAVITLLMVPAVVYLRAHYAVDVFAGILVGLGAYALTQRPVPPPRESATHPEAPSRP